MPGVAESQALNVETRERIMFLPSGEPVTVLDCMKKEHRVPSGAFFRCAAVCGRPGCTQEGYIWVRVVWTRNTRARSASFKIQSIDGEVIVPDVHSVLARKA